MNESAAIEGLSAIAHTTRMSVFRLLVKQGPQGLPAGEIARRLAIPPTTMSTHLSILARADLITPRREGRTIFYALRPQGVRDLLEFLVADCCGGQPELCAPLSPVSANCVRDPIA